MIHPPLIGGKIAISSPVLINSLSSAAFRFTDIVNWALAMERIGYDSSSLFLSAPTVKFSVQSISTLSVSKISLIEAYNFKFIFLPVSGIRMRFQLRSKSYIPNWILLIAVILIIQLVITGKSRKLFDYRSWDSCTTNQVIRNQVHILLMNGFLVRSYNHTELFFNNAPHLIEGSHNHLNLPYPRWDRRNENENKNTKTFSLFLNLPCLSLASFQTNNRVCNGLE